MANKPKITDLDEFARLDNEGWPDSQLAERYGCSLDTIRRTRKRIDLPARRPRLDDERKKLIEKRIKDGWSHAEIARVEGVDAETLRRHFPGTAWSKELVGKHAITERWARGDH